MKAHLPTFFARCPRQKLIPMWEDLTSCGYVDDGGECIHNESINSYGNVNKLFGMWVMRNSSVLKITFEHNPHLYNYYKFFKIFKT
jgi:hypothetical protein